MGKRIERLLYVVTMIVLFGCASAPKVETPAAPEAKSTCRGNELNGKKEGPWECYYPGGNLESRIHYHLGKRNGLAEMWFADGKPDFKAEFKDGVFDGRFLSYRKNGKLEHDVNYRNGLLHGKKSEWDENGTLIFEGFYKNGARHGVLREWYSNGKPKSEREYIDNEPIEQGKAWDETGKLLPPPPLDPEE